MANPLAKSILGNISEKIEQTSERISEHRGNLNPREEELLKEVIRKNKAPKGNVGVAKPLKWDEYLEHHGSEKRGIQPEIKKQPKTMISLEEFGNHLLKK